MTTITVLDPVTDINDSDLVMVTNAQGHSYTINGAELEKRNKIIIAENTTVTGAPLKAGRCVRIYFSADITANDGNTVMQINYNGVNYYVKVSKDGALSNFVAHAVGNTYKYVQAHTTLEFLVVGNQQDGFQFVIIGNPVVISNSDYSIQADGSIIYSKSVPWSLGNSNITTQYFGNNALKCYCVQSTTIEQDQSSYNFILPNNVEIHALINFYLSAVDPIDNVIQDGYYDNTNNVEFSLRSAYIPSQNLISASWTGWRGNNNLRYITLFVLYN